MATRVTLFKSSEIHLTHSSLLYVDQKSPRKGCRATKSMKILFRSKEKSSNSTYRWQCFQSTWGYTTQLTNILRVATMAVLQVSIRDVFHIKVISAGPPRKTVPSLTNKTSEILESREGTIEQRFRKFSPRISRDVRPVLRGSVDTITVMIIL